MSYYDDDYDYDDCPGCGRRDYGWEMSDVRSNLTINNCRCKPECQCDTDEMQSLGFEPDECNCEVNGCECDHISVKLVIRRVFDQECALCGSLDYRCVYDLKLDGKVIGTFKSEQAGDAYIAKVFPTAKAPERDYAWESEAGLRRAEGWG